MSITQQIGHNITTVRTVRGYTRTQLAHRLVDVGAAALTSAVIGAWERGERAISAENLYYLSLALGCSVDYLYYGSQINSQNTQQLLQQVSLRSVRERETLLYSARYWDGDSHALLQFVRMYMSVPRKYRVDVAGLAISQYKHLLHQGLIKPALNVDLRLLQRYTQQIDRG